MDPSPYLRRHGPKKSNFGFTSKTSHVSYLNQKMEVMKIKVKKKLKLKLKLMVKVCVKKDMNTSIASSEVLCTNVKKRDRSTDSSVEKVKKSDRKRVAPIVPCALAGKVDQNQLPEDMIFEVLVRIEKIKTLHQCKCVSKAWSSIINHPQFTEAYRKHHHGGLLLFTTTKMQSKRISDRMMSDSGELPPFQLFYSNLSVVEPEPFYSRLILPRSNLFRGITKVVNGLVCVYEQSRVFVYNICTGETLRLPDTDHPDPGASCIYSLGYDTSSRAYKLVKISGFEIPGSAVVQKWLPDSRLECEILTLGRDLSWRKVATAGAPTILKTPGRSVFTSGHPVVINGVMYWTTVDLVDCIRVISFDLSKEEFRLHKVPQENTWSFLKGNNWIIAQFGGRPALYYSDGGFHKCLYFYRLDDDCQDCWSKHAIPIPTEFRSMDGMARFYCPKVIGNLSTGEAILGFEGLEPICSFDFQKNEFKKLVVGDLSELRQSVDIFMSTHLEENLAPLDVQLGGV